MLVYEINDNATLYECIKAAFEGDKQLLVSYHVVGNGNLEDCVMDTFNKILETSQMITLDWYKVEHNGEKVGFIVLSHAFNLLYSFGLNKSVRGELKEPFFEKIKEMLDGFMVCTLYNRNKRGIAYLKRQGMEVIDNNYETTTLCLRVEESH